MAKKKRITLRQYYKTKHWNNLRKKYSYIDEAKCEICNCARFGFYKIGSKKGLRKPKAENKMNLHHLNYDNMMNESREDLMLLCDSCHKFFHMLEKMRKRHPMYENAYIELVKKSGWGFKRR